jgi:cobaltochelatase CobN
LSDSRARRQVDRTLGRTVENDPFFLSGPKRDFAIPAYPAAAHVVDRAATGARLQHRSGSKVITTRHLVPPHGYSGVLCLGGERQFGAHAVCHMGKHGNLEWLPGKALALSPKTCFSRSRPLAPMPNIYPFIVNDPGEGTQAKRRAAAVIIDHLTPPLTRAESYGPLKDLEQLVDEYYEAAGVDPRRIRVLSEDILSLCRTTRS